MFGKNREKREEYKRRKEIKENLKFSNKELWENISEDKRNKVIDKYYKVIDSSNVDIKILLGEVIQTRITFSVLALGMLLGVLASAAASIMLKYTPDKLLNDVIILVLCVVVFLALIKVVKDITKDDFKDYKILDRLLRSVDSDEAIKAKKISKK